MLRRVLPTLGDLRRSKGRSTDPVEHRASSTNRSADSRYAAIAAAGVQMSENPDLPARALWILVHGTFAADAAWVKADSTMAVALQDVPGVAVERFIWSGGNSGIARHKAAKELATMLDNRGGEFASVSLIGHSHGGNVMRLAAQLTQTVDVDRAIFLGTPFIKAEARDVSGLRRAALVALLLSVLLIPWNLFAGLLLDGGVLVDLKVLDLMLLLLLVLVSAMVAALTAIVVGQSVKAKAMFPDATTRSRREDHVFQARRDEAGILLRAMSFLPNLGYRILQFLSDVAIVAGKHLTTPLWIVPLGIVVVLSERTLEGLRLPLDALTLLLLSIAMSLLILVAFGATWLVFSAVMRFTPLAFGFEGFASLLALTLRVGEAPGAAEADTTACYRVQFAKGSGAGLRHSRFYSDARIIAMIKAIAAGKSEQLPDEVTTARLAVAVERREPAKWSAYAAIALLFGIPVYMLFSSMINPLLAEVTAQEVGFECENGVCREVDAAAVDAPFESGCTVQTDGTCVMEPAQ